MHTHMHGTLMVHVLGTCWGRIVAQSSVSSTVSGQKRSVLSLPAACDDQLASSKTRRPASLLFNSAPVADPVAAPTAAPAVDRGPASFTTLLDVKADRLSASNSRNDDNATPAAAPAPAKSLRAGGRHEDEITRSAAPTVTLEELLTFARELRVNEQAALQPTQ